MGEVMIYSGALIPRISVEHAIESHPPYKRDEGYGWIIGREGHECLVRIIDPMDLHNRPNLSVVKQQLAKVPLVPRQIRTAVSVYRETRIDNRVDDVASPLHTTADQTALNLAQQIGAAFRSWGVVVLQNVEHGSTQRIKPHQQV